MKTTTLYFALITLWLLGPQVILAQQTGNTIAAGGPAGIYVTLGGAILSTAHPVDGAVAYTIDRRVSGQQVWQKIATVSGPTTLSEFRSRLELSMSEVPQPIQLKSIPVDTLWQSIERYGEQDSMKIWGAILEVKLAAGTIYLDTTATKKKYYQYRVTMIKSSRQPTFVMMSNVALYPQSVSLPKLHFARKITSRKYVAIFWRSTVSSSFNVFRQTGLTGAYVEVKPKRYLTWQKDSVFHVMDDTLVQPYQLYKYYLVPQDYYGNPGAPSDTVLAGAYTFMETPPPDSMGVAKMDSGDGFRVSWRLKNPLPLRYLEIYRSLTRHSGFVKLADVSPQASYYQDQTAKPMTMYFYYLVMRGLLGESSPRSATVFGLYVSDLSPLPPTVTRAVGFKGGVRLTITATDNRVAFFHVYRNDGFHRQLRLISGLLPKRDSITFFDDTSGELSGSLLYTYAVRAEDGSHILSGFSDTVYARPVISTRPPTPMGLAAMREGNAIQLYWDDMQTFDNVLRGYVVYRKVASMKALSEKFERLTLTSLPTSQNHFTDTTAQVGVSYKYAVRAIDAFGGRSALSATAQVGIPAVAPIPPAGLTATSTGAGILLQWDQSQQPDLLDYRLYRYQRGHAPVQIATVRPSRTLRDLDTHTEEGQLYFYFLTSVNTKDVQSGRSQEVGIRR